MNPDVPTVSALAEDDFAQQHPVAVPGLAAEAVKDRAGRPAISWHVYERLPREERQNYALKVRGPGGLYLIQASKLLKWQGLGYEPLKEPGDQRAATVPAADHSPRPAQYPCFFCPVTSHNHDAWRDHMRSKHAEEVDALRSEGPGAEPAQASGSEG